MNTSGTRHAGRAIAEALAAHGAERVFAVPGESYLAVLDGLYDAPVDVVVCRHEGGAGYMAEAHGKLTGRPGVAMVTRGPGAANAFVAVHAAWQDATPMVLFVGLVPIADRQREAFQEFDPAAWFGTQAKRVLVLDEPGRASEVVAEAFYAASAGRPGPVVVGLPEDVLLEPFTGAVHAPLPVAEGAAGSGDLDAVRTALEAAQRPLLFAGGPGWTPAAAARLTRFAEDNAVPVVQDWRASDRVPFSSPANAGWLGYGRDEAAARLFAEADAVLAVGALPTDVPTDGFTLRQHPSAVNLLVSMDTELRGRSGPVARHIAAGPAAFTAALDGLALAGAESRRAAAVRARAAARAAATVPPSAQWPPTAPGTAHMNAVAAALAERMPADAVTAFGAGNHCLWAQRFLPTESYPSQLSMRNGSMGYSVPSAVAASLHAPERLVVAIAGDGEFLMNGQELATAVQYGAAMLVVVMDNGEYGTIRGHQEQHFPGRVSGTGLANPDFAGFARSFGCHAETVTADSQVAGAVDRALDAVRTARRPAVLHVVADPQLRVP